MFTICIDSNGYYTEGDGELVEVKEMPDNLEHARHLLSYKYNPETKLLEVDNNKLKEVKEMLSNIKEQTLEEKIQNLEDKFSKISNFLNMK